MTLHNFVCSLVSLYTFTGVLFCFSVIESTFKLGPDQCLLPYFRVYRITKMLELFDTVIMILRHRRQQISFLHVYHHTTMVLIRDAGYHFFPLQKISIYVATNALVHFITYLFYGLSTFFPNKLLPWRKTNTKIEIIEFLVLNVHVTFGYLNNDLCIYSVLYGITILSLNIYNLPFELQNLQNWLKIIKDFWVLKKILLFSYCITSTMLCTNLEKKICMLFNYEE